MNFSLASMKMLLALFLMAEVKGEEAKSPQPAVTVAKAAIELPGIHNAFRVTGQIFSGSQPENDASFAALAKLGVKTILSVDGAKPDVEAARRHGLRYVHLPFGYNGIPAERAFQLARAAATVPGPVFIHCHHGKHRGPAAVALVCQAAQGWTPAQGEAWLREAGTGPEYPGLYRAVREFKPAAPEELEKAAALPEVTQPSDLVDVMVEIDEHFDALKALQKTGWKTPPQVSAKPGPQPAQEATLLWEQLRECGRLEDTARRSEDYRVKMADSERLADSLRLALAASSPDEAVLNDSFKAVAQSCVVCHQAHRNEKK